jgi:tripartite-type tricarboxylate transporter receptor subunit TctC
MYCSHFEEMSGAGKGMAPQQVTGMGKEVFMRRDMGLAIFAVVMLGTATIHSAPAADYPLKTIEIVCPYTPGSSMDIMSRIIAEIAPKYLKQSVVVTNKPGAAGSLAAADVISSNPDGYKLVTLTNFFFATTIKTQKVPFEQNDLVPIANFMEYKLGMIVRGDSPWKTLGDLLAYGKKNPGKLRWAHTGRGITLHLNGLIIFRKAGVETIDIPYKGSPEKLTALLGGHVDASTMVYGAVKDHVTSGKVRYLVFFGDHRYADPPNVPSAVELGFPEAAKLVTYIGLYAHKHTPEEIKNKLIDAFRKTYEDPEFKKGIERMGDEPRFEGPEFMKESIKRGEEIGVPLIKELGLYVGK